MPPRSVVGRRRRRRCVVVTASGTQAAFPSMPRDHHPSSRYPQAVDGRRTHGEERGCRRPHGGRQRGEEEGGRTRPPSPRADHRAPDLARAPPPRGGEFAPPSSPHDRRQEGHGQKGGGGGVVIIGGREGREQGGTGDGQVGRRRRSGSAGARHVHDVAEQEAEKDEHGHVLPAAQVQPPRGGERGLRQAPHVFGVGPAPRYYRRNSEG
mmetsp:Transcript_2557/g.6389  ORF Transcript_2557/g.6389 Transcript_2557/m.6389 type:complete len:209 (+) Transcript_2557:516-1142(+)